MWGDAGLWDFPKTCHPEQTPTPRRGPGVSRSVPPGRRKINSVRVGKKAKKAAELGFEKGNSHDGF